MSRAAVSTQCNPCAQLQCYVASLCSHTGHWRRRRGRIAAFVCLPLESLLRPKEMRELRRPGHDYHPMAVAWRARL